MIKTNYPRCCRCHAPLTYNEQTYHGLSCNHCELDYLYSFEGYKNYDYWKRFTGYTLRCLWHGIGRIGSVCLRILRKLLRIGRCRGF